MAGGKETPRQKLIGLMYLVLLALLALQVSSAIMEKFKFLDDSLQHANNSADEENIKVEQSIKKAVADNGNKAADQAVLNQAAEVRKEAAEIKAYIEGLRKEIVDKTGGLEDPEDKGSMYKGAKEETAIEVLMVGGANKGGKGYKLKEEVNKFVADLNKIMNGKKTFKNIALDAKEDPRIPKNSEQAKKDFAELNFAQTPMVAAMASLSNIESEVLNHETEALSILSQEVGATELKFDNVFAMYRADSRVVAAGTKYNAELFMAASSSTLNPTITVDGRPLKIVGGRGQLEFTATGGAYDADGNAKKSWNGQITIKNKGKDTTFSVKGEYVVAKPVIQIQSASVSALYKNCGNELSVQVPALGSTYQPSFKASGADLIPGTKGKVTVVPNSPSVKLTVYSGGNLIGDQDFKVRLIPKPEIVALNGGKPVDTKMGVNSPGPRAIQMQAKPDESFKNFLPLDARYKITDWNAILVRGKRPVKTSNFSGELGNFNEFNSAAQPGDRIVIEVKAVKRMNFKGVIEDVNVGQPIINIPLN